VTIIRASHTGENGFDVVIDLSRKAELLQALETAGAQPISEDTLEILRVEAGIARFGQDIDETNVVPETNLDEAVSFTKGCYVGQEIIVRIKHRGHPAKKLIGLRFETDAQIESGAIIHSTENQEIGRVTSAVVSPRLGSIGLGYVRYEHLAEGTRVVASDGINATVTGLPFVGTNG
jgi:folate-binding protein YgfZ